MRRRSGVTVTLLLLLLAGPLGLLELDHERLHCEDGSSATHPECPICFAAKTPVVVATPSEPLPDVVIGTVTIPPQPELPEPAALLRTAPPRGPPALS